MNDKLIISVAISGAGTTKQQNPAVPITPEEIAADVVACAKAGAAIAHIHVRDEKGMPTMSVEAFSAAVAAVRRATKEAGVDVVLNLTTSGAKASDEERIAHLPVLKPEMCSYDVGSMNWANAFVFENTPHLLEILGKCTIENEIKPEIEIFDSGMIGNSLYYIKKGFLKTPAHYQFVLGVPGGMDGTAMNLAFLRSMLPEGSTWSCTGIGKTHIPMLLTSIAMGSTGVRVGLEDNIMYGKGQLATNAQLVERAARIAREAGREIASAADAREILGLRRPE